MNKFIYAVMLFFVVAFSGCGGGSSGDGDGSSQQTDTGGTTTNSPGGTGSGTGGSNNGTTGSGTTGGGTTGGSGSSTGSGSSGVVYGTFDSLYTGSNNQLNIENCSLPASVLFSSSVFRLVNQTENNVDAALTFTPEPSLTTAFDQLFVTVNGAFQGNGDFSGNITSIFSLAGNVVARGQGEVKILVDDVTSSLSLQFIQDTTQQTCNLSGTIDMSVPSPDTGGGGTGGGDTGGGTTGGGDTGGGTTGGGTTGGGTTGGGTGGSTGGGTSISAPGGTTLLAYGQFGTLQFQSNEFPTDSGSFEMTEVMYTNSGGFETFAWTNDVEATVDIYPSLPDGNGGTFSTTTFNSVNGRSYACRCVPTIDLLNNQVIFSSMVLTATQTPGATITIDGMVSYP